MGKNAVKKRFGASHNIIRVVLGGMHSISRSEKNWLRPAIALKSRKICLCGPQPQKGCAPLLVGKVTAYSYRAS